MNLKPVTQLSLYGHHLEFLNFIELYKSQKLPNKIPNWKCKTTNLITLSPY